MTRWRVTRTYTITVEAEDEEEADEKASEIPEGDWEQSEEIDWEGE